MGICCTVLKPIGRFASCQSLGMCNWLVHGPSAICGTHGKDSPRTFRSCTCNFRNICDPLHTPRQGAECDAQRTQTYREPIRKYQQHPKAMIKLNYGLLGSCHGLHKQIIGTCLPSMPAAQHLGHCTVRVLPGCIYTS